MASSRRCGAGSSARDRAAGECLNVNVATIDRELDGQVPIPSNPIADLSAARARRRAPAR